MRFPATIHLQVNDAREYEAVMVALQAANDHSVDQANTIGLVIDRLKVTEAGSAPKNLPEAYLVVDGRRVSEGTRTEMEGLFSTEIAAHRAPVTLQARPPGSLEYKQARQRIATATG